MNYLDKNKIESLKDIAKDAGNAINNIYHSNFQHQLKSDNSPITEADLISNKIISSGLKKIDDIPILSEEASDVPFDIRSKWNKYWLIDPLDGTKEFIKKNGEFTVNIALVVGNSPVFGLIQVPTTNEIYWGSSLHGSFFCPSKGKNMSIEATKKSTNGPVKMAVSRSHLSDEHNSLLNNNIQFDVVYAGSSLKFCYVASGKSDCYLRLGPTSEWDTAAGEAILKYAGGSVVDLTGKPIQYNFEDKYLNPNFLASSNDDIKEIILDLLSAN